MIHQLQQSLWRQFGASIDMLTNVIANCPDEYIANNKRFYYLAYHSVIFLDYYLTIPPADFSPMLSFTNKEEIDRPVDSIGDMIPDKIYSKDELLNYIKASRVKCKNLIECLAEDEALDRSFAEGDQEGDMNYPILEILLYNMRHTQHHTGQLNLMLRQNLYQHIGWAFRVDELI